MSGDAWWLYLIQCADGSLYVGITQDVPKRFAQHVKGQAALHTRTHRATAMLGCRLVGTRREATREERRLKRLGRARKLLSFNIQADSVPAPARDRRPIDNAERILRLAHCQHVIRQAMRPNQSEEA